MQRRTKFFWSLALLAGLLFLLGVRHLYAWQKYLDALAVNSGHRKEIEVEMSAPPELALGRPLALTVHVKPLIDAPEVTLRWSLPSGVTLLDGPAEENLGAISANQTVTLVRQVQIDSPGVHRIGVQASFQPHPVAYFGDAALLFFTLDEQGGSVSTEDPQALARLHERIPPGPDASVEVTTAGAQPDATGAFCVNIFGRFTRQDKVFNGTSQVTNIVPVTHAVVEIWEDDVIFDDHYGTTTPDDNGNFGWTSCADDGLFGGDMEYYVKVVAKAEGAIDDLIATVEPAPPFFIDLPDVPFFPDELHNFETGNLSIGGAGNLDFGTMELNEEKSAAINIVEAIYEAWHLWNESDGDEDRTEYDIVDVYWSPGGGYGTYYVPFLDNMYIQGEGAEADEWDDSVIIHEWTHFADDKWGCDENPGGTHTGVDIVDPQLAWGEGYPDFYQSVVRTSLGQPRGDWYVDLNDLGACSVCFDLENWHINHPGSLSDSNELSIAAALLDVIDFNNDGQDLVALPEGYTFIEEIFLHPDFVDVDIKYCSFQQYLSVWAGAGGPTDAAIAAAITQNTNLAQVFPVSIAAAAQGAAQSLLLPGNDYRWWERVTYVVDNSLSMAGQRLNAVKTVLQEQVDDLFAAVPEGVEFRMDTFNNSSATNKQVFTGQFYPAMIKPAIAGLTASAEPDSLCPVDAFGALKQAVEGETNVNAWLFTDNYPTATLAPLENFRAELVAHDVSASFAILQAFSGGPCSTPFPSTQLFARQQQLQRQWLFTAGSAPTEPSNSIVPYLLTAQATGGQFLFVEEGQMEFAAQILQAQLSHNAGAGRWSDYVSVQPTYRYDRLASWEYEWRDAIALGTALPSKPGGLGSEGYVDAPLPAPFTFYSRPVTIAHVYENGYLTLGDEFGEAQDNTQLPNAAAPNGALYPYWDDLEWDFVTAAAQPTAPQAEFGRIYTATVDDWYVIQYDQYASPTSGGFTEKFQVLLNLENGEIRYQYDTVNNGVAGATIGLESWGDFNPMNGVQASFNDTGAAESGMGYRFVPVPPQPSKTYSVTVDATMQSIGFLLTGYNGTLAPMVVRPPGAAPLVCNSGGVLCVNLGLVQYVQVNVNGRTGLWTVEVQPGASGSGTYSFTSMAAGPLPATSPSDRTLPSFQASVLLLDLGQPVDNNRLDAQLLTPANHALSLPFAFFDDGAHGDNRPGDGLFGSEPVQPQQNGAGYLWVDGELDGQPFRRVDPKPFSFQPLRLDGPNAAPSLEAKTVVSFTLHNNDVVSHTFRIDVQVPQGWRGQLDLPGDGLVSVDAGISRTLPIAIWMGPTDPEALAQPSGTTGTVNIAAIEAEQGALYDSAAVQITRNRPPAHIEILIPYHYMAVDNSAPIKFNVLDAQNTPVIDGTVLQLSTTLGSLPPSVVTFNGYAEALFAAGSQTGTAQITAQTSNGISATLAISITPPLAERILISATADSLPADGKATTPVVVTVLDDSGAPLANQPVRVGVEGGGDTSGGNQYGRVNGSEVISGTTNAAGKFQVTYTSGTLGGPVGVRAELVRDETAVRDARVEILLVGDTEQTLRFPFVRR